MFGVEDQRLIFCTQVNKNCALVHARTYQVLKVVLVRKRGLLLIAGLSQRLVRSCIYYFGLLKEVMFRLATPRTNNFFQTTRYEGPSFDVISI